MSARMGRGWGCRFARGASSIPSTWGRGFSKAVIVSARRKVAPRRGESQPGDAKWECHVGMPTGIGIIDLMLGIPSPDRKPSYEFLEPLLRDRESRESFEFPVEYIFKHVPKTGTRDDYVKYTLEQMDQWGIERALIGVDAKDETGREALRRDPDRFIPSR